MNESRPKNGKIKDFFQIPTGEESNPCYIIVKMTTPLKPKPKYKIEVKTKS